MNNPQWRDAPIYEVRWNPEFGDHVAIEASRRETDDAVIIQLEVLRQTGDATKQVLGHEERRFPKRFNQKDYSPC